MLSPLCHVTRQNTENLFLLNQLDSAPCLSGQKMHADLAVVVDIKPADVHYLVTLAGTLKVSAKGTKVGIISMDAAKSIHLKFNESPSGNQTLLMQKIRNAGKNQEGNYDDALGTVRKLFTKQNGERGDKRNVLLFITDATTKINLGKINDILKKLKVIFLVNAPVVSCLFKSSRSWAESIKDGAYYCYCAYVLRIARYSGFLWVVPSNTGIFCPV